MASQHENKKFDKENRKRAKHEAKQLRRAQRGQDEETEQVLSRRREQIAALRKPLLRNVRGPRY